MKRANIYGQSGGKDNIKITDYHVSNELSKQSDIFKIVNNDMTLKEVSELFPEITNIDTGLRQPFVSTNFYSFLQGDYVYIYNKSDLSLRKILNTQTMVGINQNSGLRKAFVAGGYAVLVALASYNGNYTNGGNQFSVYDIENDIFIHQNINIPSLGNYPQNGSNDSHRYIYNSTYDVIFGLQAYYNGSQKNNFASINASTGQYINYIDDINYANRCFSDDQGLCLYEDGSYNAYKLYISGSSVMETTHSTLHSYFRMKYNKIDNYNISVYDISRGCRVRVLENFNKVVYDVNVNKEPDGLTFMSGTTTTTFVILLVFGRFMYISGYGGARFWIDVIDKRTLGSEEIPLLNCDV